jgi:hypothetical protein
VERSGADNIIERNETVTSGHRVMNCWSDLVCVWAVVQAVIMCRCGWAAPELKRGTAAPRADGARTGSSPLFGCTQESDPMSRMLRGQFERFWCGALHSADLRARQAHSTCRLVLLTTRRERKRAKELRAWPVGAWRCRPVRSSC